MFYSSKLKGSSLGSMSHVPIISVLFIFDPVIFIVLIRVSFLLPVLCATKACAIEANLHTLKFARKKVVEAYIFLGIFL